MAKIFITGSADGLGLMAGRLLAEAGHEVILHGRNRQRAKEALQAIPKAVHVVYGDLSSIAETRVVAEQVNALGIVDVVIHNAAVGYREQEVVTTDGLSHVFAVNSLAPYILTALITKPKRLIYISSGLHRSAELDLSDLAWRKRRWNGFQAYADSKLYNVVLAFAIARLWPDVYCNALEPGWVATKMGGPGAPDSLEDAPKTQVWLASSNDAEARVSGKYFYHKKIREHNPVADNIDVQDEFMAYCASVSGTQMPV
ncbi:MAG TPA: SDR family NAD(P)-dependent oxidoreductase [Ohtaekwangia sp.]|uniref:SDR family NAD(P)-dependent oxidoreductase n=1 Tax=Ohtaekwangia sp. TaxID=2066019 RepID=UPI002F91DE03